MVTVIRNRNRQIKTVIVPLPTGGEAIITARQFLGTTKSNVKLAKGEKYGWNVASLSLAPHKSSGVMNTCPNATAGCKAGCIFTSGHAGIFKSINRGRIARTVLLHQSRDIFQELLFQELERHRQVAKSEGQKLCVRLNVFSDIVWEELFPTLFNCFADVQFYDYTKIVRRAIAHAEGKFPPNYHLTFSRSESNMADSHKILRMGGNVAFVFGHSRQRWEDCRPKNIRFLEDNGKTKSYPVVNGEASDLRFLEGKQGLVVGLYAKGKGRKDKHGFVMKTSY